MKNTTNKLPELQTLLVMQDGYFETVNQLVEYYFNTGQDKKAIQLCSRGIEKAINARRELEYLLLSLID